MSNVCTQANMIYTCVNLYVVSVTPPAIPLLWILEAKYKYGCGK